MNQFLNKAARVYTDYVSMNAFNQWPAEEKAFYINLAKHFFCIDVDFATLLNKGDLLIPGENVRERPEGYKPLWWIERDSFSYETFISFFKGNQFLVDRKQVIDDVLYIMCTLQVHDMREDFSELLLLQDLENQA